MDALIHMQKGKDRKTHLSDEKVTLPAFLNDSFETAYYTDIFLYFKIQHLHTSLRENYMLHSPPRLNRYGLFSPTAPEFHISRLYFCI